MRSSPLALLLLAAPAAGWATERTAAAVSAGRAAVRATAPIMQQAPAVARDASGPTLGARAAAAAAAAAATSPASPTLDRFIEQFRGEFDNHEQIAYETTAGLTPREGGGHEHIHCSLRTVALHDRPQDGRHVLATYYFNGNPDIVFRERLYELDALPHDPQFGSCIRMRIYKPRPEVSERLRAGCGVDDFAWSAAEDLHHSLHVDAADVYWRWCGERFEGSMRTESVEIISERSGQPITVRDDVALWQDALWVNDRGSDAATGAYVYGNIHDIPYKMARVADDHWTVRGEASREAPAE